MEPWSSEAALNNPFFNSPGYSTFLPSGSPIAGYDTARQESRPRSSERIQRVQEDRPHATVVQSEQAVSQELQWEHIFLADGSLQNRRERPKSPRDSVRGKRKGPLTPEGAQNAIEVRGVNACWRCWSQRVGVRLHDTLFPLFL